MAFNKDQFIEDLKNMTVLELKEVVEAIEETFGVSAQPVAVAGGAVIDWKYYEVMYGERYMDTPEENPQGYEDTRVSNYIKNLKGNILYIHGYIDATVVPQNMLDISQAAITEGKVIHTFLYPNQEHNVRGNESIHLTKTIVDFVLKNNVETNK